MDPLQPLLFQLSLEEVTIFFFEGRGNKGKFRLEEAFTNRLEQDENVFPEEN
jgi:hypothetical protein